MRCLPWLVHCRNVEPRTPLHLLVASDLSDQAIVFFEQLGARVFRARNSEVVTLARNHDLRLIVDAIVQRFQNCAHWAEAAWERGSNKCRKWKLKESSEASKYTRHDRLPAVHWIQGCALYSSLLQEGTDGPAYVCQ